MLSQQPNSGAGPEGFSQHTVPPRPKKPWYLRWWAITLGAIIVISVVGNLLGDGSSTTTASAPGADAVAAAEATDSAAAEASASAAAASAEAALAEAQADVEAAASEEAAAAEAEAKRQAAEDKAAAEAAAAAQKKAKAAEKKRIDSAEPVSARELSLIVKKPDAHAGETLVVFGEITQFDSATGACIFRSDIAQANMADSWDYEHNSIFTAGDGDTDCPELDEFVADDQVRITATVVSAFSYDTQIGGSTTVPLFKVEKIARVK